MRNIFNTSNPVFAGLLFCLLFCSVTLSGTELPKLTRPVTDEASLFTSDQASALEQKLIRYDRATSTQIAVLVVKDLHGYAISDYAFQVAEGSGIGRKGSDNGVLIVLKPKTLESKGQVFIAPGYGLEGVIPDAVAKRIVENEMIPHFKKNDYYAGVSQAVNTLMALAEGEFEAKEYMEKTNRSSWSKVLGILFFLLVFFLFWVRGTRNYARANNLSFWTAIFMMNALSGSHRGTFGNFSSGSGGFGGFGGGSFGGGGAGGSW